jgi:hypothetical protein
VALPTWLRFRSKQRDAGEPRSRAIVVLGMHRSGTSAVARGLEALGVYLGNDFLDPQPENPTGYWEDRRIVELDDRVLKTFGLNWDDIAPIAPREFERRRLRRLRRDAIRDLRARFTMQPIWGFKDPRTIRVLPFWLRVLRDCRVDDSYILVIRNPASVAASLFARQRMDLATAQRLWLVYVVPFLELVANKPLLVVDYDLLMLDPRAALDRIAHRLKLPSDRVDAAQVDAFAGKFLDPRLRHSVFAAEDIDTSGDAGHLIRDAYAALYELAADRNEPDPAFWLTWERIQAACRTRLAWPSIE